MAERKVFRAFQYNETRDSGTFPFRKTFARNLPDSPAGLNRNCDGMERILKDSPLNFISRLSFFLNKR